MSWDKHAAVTYARQHAHTYSTGFCARAIAAAIRAGGVSIEGANAKDFGRTLRAAGFKQVYGTLTEGDIAVIDALPGPHQYGHACIYDGFGTWYSDFRQHSMYPGAAYRETQPHVTYYRHH